MLIFVTYALQHHIQMKSHRETWTPALWNMRNLIKLATFLGIYVCVCLCMIQKVIMEIDIFSAFFVCRSVSMPMKWIIGKLHNSTSSVPLAHRIHCSWIRVEICLKYALINSRLDWSGVKSRIWKPLNRGKNTNIHNNTIIHTVQFNFKMYASRIAISVYDVSHFHFRLFFILLFSHSSYLSILISGFNETSSPILVERRKKKQTKHNNWIGFIFYEWKIVEYKEHCELHVWEYESACRILSCAAVCLCCYQPCPIKVRITILRYVYLYCSRIGQRERKTCDETSYCHCVCVFYVFVEQLFNAIVCTISKF